MVSDNQGKKCVPFKAGLFNMPTRTDEKVHLIGSHCSHCNTTYFPAREFCINCSEKTEEVSLNRRGKILSFTIVRQAPPLFETPYVLAYVDLPEKVRIFTQISSNHMDSLKMDMEVELVLEKFREDDKGNIVIGYRFKPVQEIDNDPNYREYPDWLCACSSV